MFAKQFAIAGSEDIRSRWSWAQNVAKAIDGSTFKIDAGKQWRLDAILAVAEQLPRLLRSSNVTREKDHAGRLHLGQQGRQPRGHLCAIKADNEQLSGRLRQNDPPQSVP